MTYVLQWARRLCRWTANPGEQHLQAFKKVLRYLKGTLDMKLVYKRPTKKYNDDNRCIKMMNPWATATPPGLKTLTTGDRRVAMCL